MAQCIYTDSCVVADDQCTCPAPNVVTNGQCVCPAPNVLANGACTCPPPNVLTNGQCTAPTAPSGPAPSGGASRRRRAAEIEAHKAIAMCASRKTQACGVFGGGEWECVDTERDLESCEPLPSLRTDDMVLNLDLGQAVAVWFRSVRLLCPRQA